MYKFFITNNQIKEDIITIIGQDVKHILNVLRLKKEDKIQICIKETGKNYICKIADIYPETVTCKILEESKTCLESNVSITIFQGLPKADKMELIIQKCTELGVKEIVPVEMERCVVKLDKKSEVKKIERWQKIAETAAKQSKRNNICKINNIINIKNICNLINEYDILLVPYENEENNSFKESLRTLVNKGTFKIGIVIGPEGGFEEKEIELLKQNGGKIITLGKRILRTETVAIAMTSAIMYEFNELG